MTQIETTGTIKYVVAEKKDGTTYDYLSVGGYDEQGEYVELTKVFLGKEDSITRYIAKNIGFVPKAKKN